MIINQTYELETVNLSGLPLAGLNIDAYEGDYAIDFTTPNPTGQGNGHISLGSGDFRGSSLLNSRFDRLTVRTVSGRIRLAFDGLSLEHDMIVQLESESGGVWLEIPGDIPAQITFTTDSGRVIKLEAGYEQVDSTIYETGGYHLGDSPRLHIVIDTVRGDLRLTNCQRTASGA